MLNKNLKKYQLSLATRFMVPDHFVFNMTSTMQKLPNKFKFPNSKVFFSF